MNANYLVQIGRIFLSFLFIFSGLSKLLSMPFFDDMVMEFLIGPDYFDFPKAMWWTQLLTRVLVAGELVIGLALLQNRWFKTWVMWALMGMLTLFTIHLFYEGFANPNGFVEGNCGCFGDVLPMTILESILKNVVAMIIGIYVWLKFKDVKQQSFASWVAPTLVGLTALFTTAFGIKSIPSEANESAIVIEDDQPTDEIAADSITLTDGVESDGDEETVNDEDDLTEGDKTDPSNGSTELAEISVDDNPSGMKDAEDPDVDKDDTDDAPLDIVVEPTQNTINLLKKFNSFSDGSKINFESGTSLVCLFSMSCSHCQEVYKEMCELSDQLPKTYLINYGVEFEQSYFFKQAGGCKHPHNLTNNFTEFKRALEGSTYPRIIVFKDGKIARQWDVDTYSRKSFMKFFGMSEPEKKDEGGLDLQMGESPW